MPMTVEDLNGVPAMFIKVSRLYKEDMSTQELYDAVRWAWRVSLERAQRAQVVYAVANGRVVGVFNNPTWQRCTAISQAPEREEEAKARELIEEGRCFFTCEKRDVDNAFRRIPQDNMLDAQLNGNGGRAVCRYFNC